MQLHASPLDVNRVFDEIDQDVGLGAGGEFEFVLKDPSGFFHAAGVAQIEVGKGVEVFGPTWGHQGQEQENGAAAQKWDLRGMRDQKIMIGVPTRARV